MPDLHAGHADIDSPARRWFDITPGAANLAIVPKALWVDVGGTLILRGDDGVSGTFTVAAGLVQLAPTAVTGGTATGIHGLTDPA